MDWSRAKTIFIISFLILDVFLIYQVTVQKNQNTFDLMKKTSIMDSIKADDITFPPLPVDPKTEYYIEGTMKNFKGSDLSSISKKFKITNDNYVHYELEEPYQLNENWTISDIDQFVKLRAYQGNQYKFWNYDEETNQIIYYQTYRNKTLFQNASGKITIQLNKDHDIVKYTQTYFENIKEIKEKEIVTAEEALAILYKGHHIKTGSKVTGVELGYYTSTSIMTSQLLVPTWHFQINGDTNIFVNAVEGHVFSETQVLE